MPATGTLPFIVASVGTKSPLKDWGVENWRRLLAELGRDFSDHGLVLLGSPDESERSDELAQAWLGPRANLCGATSPRVSAAILAEARLFVGHDSGPMHLAAALGVRVFAIFGPTDPRLFGPYPIGGPLNHVIQAPVADLKLLSVRDVYTRFQRIRSR